MGSDSPPTTLTTADLDRLEALLASAAPGKWQAEAFAYARATDWIEGEDDDWFVHDGSGSITGPGTDKADAQAIVALHNMAPALIALARRAMSDNRTTIRDVDALRSRMLAGETLHHGVAPGETKESWWLRPSMTPVASSAVQLLKAKHNAE